MSFLTDPGNRPPLVALGVLLGAMGAARFGGPGSLTTAVALLALFAVPLLAVRYGGRQGLTFALAASVGALYLLRPGEGVSIPALLAHRFAYFAIPPLVLSLVLADRDRDRLGLGPLHLYGPAAVMGLGVFVHFVLRRGARDAGEGEIQSAAAVYALCYLALIAVAARLRLQSAATSAARASRAPDGTELEEQGRFGLASRAYEREGHLEKAAQAAERGGDWARAGNLYRRHGDDFNAAEMYYRASMWTEALDAYERNGALAAAARVAVQAGDVDRAVALLEQAGDRGAVVRTLEEAGRQPTGDQYRLAGLPGRAAEAFEQAGAFARAADIYENELDDQDRAASLHLQAGSFMRAARLFEKAGRRQEALEAYAASADGKIDAARLFLVSGHAQEAATLVAGLSAAELEAVDDEATLLGLAKALVKVGRTDDAIRVLQTVTRRGSGSGTARFLLGCALLKKELNDLAAEELQAALSYGLDAADEMRAAYLLGCIHDAADRHAEALEIFHGLLQKDIGYADVQERYRRLRAGGAPVPAPRS